MTDRDRSGSIEASMGRLMRSQFFRFVLTGGSTTLVSYAIYLLLLGRTGHQVAYAISFVVGVVWSYTVNTIFVFGQPWTLGKMLRFPLVYIGQYVVSALLLEVLVDWLKVSAIVAPLIIVIVTIPLTFVLARRIVVPADTSTSLPK